MRFLKGGANQMTKTEWETFQKTLDHLAEQIRGGLNEIAGSNQAIADNGQYLDIEELGKSIERGLYAIASAIEGRP